MADLTAAFVAQLDAVVAKYAELRRKSKYDDLSDLSATSQQLVVSMCRAAVHRIAGPGSPYAAQLDAILKRPPMNEGYRAQMALGVVESLRIDVGAGFLRSASELIHGEVFADFLEMADHLREQGYKDAAAVIAGSALEAHLRQLCAKFNVATATQSDQRAKKADQLNSDLAAAAVYGKLDQKNVTAWLDLRNKAAHGHYGQYSADQVALMTSGVRDFMTRNPA